MKSNQKYDLVKRSIILLSLGNLFFLYILGFCITDYFVREKDLIIDSGIIKDVYKNKYKELGSRFKGMVYVKCIDIELFDKPYFIRLSDGIIDEYWPQIITLLTSQKG